MPTLADIAELLNSPVPPGVDGNQPITGLATLADAEPGHLTLVGSDKFVPQLGFTRASAALVGRRVKLPPEWEGRSLRVDDADLATAKVLKLFAPPPSRPPVGIDRTARVDASASLGEGAAVGPNVVIGPRTRLGKNATIHAGAFIGEDVTAGDDCEIFHHVVIRERITLGNRVVVNASSVLGTDGFGYRWDGKQHQKVPQVGTIVIEDDVEIGSCVCIDRAKFSQTRIGRGTKIDNLVQIAHNVKVGPHCIIVGFAGLAGSCELGTGVILGGQTAVRDHIKMGDGSIAAACSAVAEDVPAKAIVSGTPAIPHRQSLREQAALRRLPDLVAQVRKLQEELDAIKNRLEPSTP